MSPLHNLEVSINHNLVIIKEHSPCLRQREDVKVQTIFLNLSFLLLKSLCQLMLMWALVLMLTGDTPAAFCAQA